MSPPIEGAPMTDTMPPLTRAAAPTQGQPITMHQGVLPSATIWSLSAISSSQVFGTV